MNNIDAIIAQVLSQFKRYNVSDVIDENSMYRDVILAIRGFGNDITTLQEDIVEIRNGEGKLPDNFYRLKGAILCQPDNIHFQNVEYRQLVELGYVSNLSEITSRWNICDNDCCNEVEDKIYTKEVYFAENSRVRMNYKKIKYLKLGRTVDRKSCTTDCENFGISNEQDEITITGDKLRANFNEGSIHILYRGFPTNEEGEMELPETPNGYLEKYIEGLLKVETAERIITNGDNVEGLMRLYSSWKQDLVVLKRKASNELKTSEFNMAKVTKNIVLANRKETRRLMVSRR